MRSAPNNNEMRKKIQDYSYGLTDIIGKGFSSNVFRGLNERTREQVAIKVIDLRSLRDKPARHMLEGEIEALKKLNHINIMRCYDIYSTVNNCYIITEFCNEGDLQNLIKKREKLPEDQAIPIFRDIVNGFKVIAESGFLHRDLKPANILLKDKIGKIADFGFAKKVTSNPKQSVNVGSPLYMSPQALKHNIYTVKNDIWSLGIILYEMLHGRAPWESSTERQLLEKISRQNYTLNRNISEDIKDFIKKCLNNDQTKRLNFSEFCSHPFIARITEENDIPQLLRKNTSCNSNEVQNKEFNSNKAIGSQQNASSEPLVIYHHRKNGLSKPKTQKLFTTQVNFMRFIFRLLQLFPPAEESGLFSLGLRFIATKQMFSLLENLTESLNKQNPFNFQGWDEFTSSQDKVDYYKSILSDYSKRYERFRKQFEELINLVKKDRRLMCICDLNFARSELLSILAIKYSIEECKTIWADLQKKQNKNTEQQFKLEFKKEGLRLDFIITYFQLNSMLVDNFSDHDYFSRQSKLETIIEYKPLEMPLEARSEIQRKLKTLQIIK